MTGKWALQCLMSDGRSGLEPPVSTPAGDRLHPPPPPLPCRLAKPLSSPSSCLTPLLLLLLPALQIGQAAFLTQLLEIGFIHGDPHPGNLLKV